MCFVARVMALFGKGKRFQESAIVRQPLSARITFWYLGVVQQMEDLSC